MTKFILIIILMMVHSCAHLTEQDNILFRAEDVESKAYITKKVSESGNYWYHTENKRYRFVRIPYNPDKYPYFFLLILEEKTESFAIGSDGSGPKMNLTAWGVKDGTVGPKLWHINHSGDEWEPLGDKIIIKSVGCCDSPTQLFYYDALTGKFDKEETLK